MSKGIGQNTRDHKTLDTVGRADMQMTLETLFLEPSSTVALLTVLSPIKRHWDRVNAQTQGRSTKHN